jgi:hypothetical protein
MPIKNLDPYNICLEDGKQIIRDNLSLYFQKIYEFEALLHIHESEG